MRSASSPRRHHCCRRRRRRCRFLPVPRRRRLPRSGRRRRRRSSGCSGAPQSILVHKTDEDRVMVLDSHKLMGASGEPGDRVQFTDYIQKNLHLYQFRNTIPLSTAATANFTRGELATALRKVEVGTRPAGCGAILSSRTTAISFLAAGAPAASAVGLPWSLSWTYPRNME